MSGKQRLTATHRLRISRGNRKLGKLPSLSLPPIVTCAAGIPCAADCYALNMLRGPYGKRIREAWQANLDFLLQDRSGFYTALERYFTRSAPAFFRYHIGGDFIDSCYLKTALKLARKFPAIKFLAFSKQFSIFPHPRAVPGNFALIASGWSGGVNPPAGYRVAWMRDSANPDPRIPARALECYGGCDRCALCWNLRKLRSDVVFDKH
jgi:hypothetical protein